MRQCEWKDCEKRHLARGLCGMHYRRQRHGDPMDAPSRTKPIGTTRRNKGYVLEKAPDGKWVQQHRLVYERWIGRKLGPGEEIHHIMPHSRHINEIHNLELCSKEFPHPPGQRVADAIIGYIGWLCRYADIGDQGYLADLEKRLLARVDPNYSATRPNSESPAKARAVAS